MTTYSVSAFKRSALRFLIGRIANAAIGFTAFLFIARHLPPSEYAYYIAAFACLELGLVIFGFGMEWVTAVYIPEIRIKASGHDLERFVWQCAIFQSTLLIVGGLALWLIAPNLVKWLDLRDGLIVFHLYAGVLAIEGIGRVFRDQLLSCLLLQGSAQSSQLARNSVLLIFVLALPYDNNLQTAQALAFAEIAASSLSLAISLIVLIIFLRNNRNAKGSGENWSLPKWGTLYRAGFNAWVSNMSNLTWSGQTVVLLATRLTGPDFTAALGFARNLAEQIKRYLPLEFLLGILRTFLISSFVKDNSEANLGVRAGLLYRINLLFLLPIFALAIVHGDAICDAISNGRYGSAQWLLVGWLSVLIFWSHHRVTDLLAHTVKQSALCRKSSILLLIAPFALAVAAHFQDWRVMFLILAIAELSYSILVLIPLKIYQPNWFALSKFGLATIVMIVGLSVQRLGVGSYFLPSQAAVAFSIMFSIVIILRAWSNEEVLLLRSEKQ